MVGSGKVYLGLGSNSGDSLSILAGAIRELRALLGETKVSSLYRSRPMYVSDQPDFLNCVLEGTSPEQDPLRFLDACQGVEARWGRDRSRERPKGERSLDIDILLWDGVVAGSERLILPHPGMRERKFVLLPLLELDPRIEGPDGSGPYLDSLDTLPDQGIYYASMAEYASILP